MSPFDTQTLTLAAAALDACRGAGMMLATAESCTGGLIAGALTAVAGSSEVVDRGFVTYSNEAKQDLLGVAHGLIARYGAVSEQVARAMAEGAQVNSRAQIAVAVTGIAGPGGGSPEKPVGLVHLACSRAGCETVHRREIFPGDRDAVRAATVKAALEMIRDAAASPHPAPDADT